MYSPVDFPRATGFRYMGAWPCRSAATPGTKLSDNHPDHFPVWAHEIFIDYRHPDPARSPSLQVPGHCRRDRDIRRPFTERFEM